MCHQTGGMTVQAVRTSAATPPQIDFVVKAGLATSPRQDGDIADEVTEEKA